jgi:hypothetical protein
VAGRAVGGVGSGRADGGEMVVAAMEIVAVHRFGGNAAGSDTHDDCTIGGQAGLHIDWMFGEDSFLFHFPIAGRDGPVVHSEGTVLRPAIKLVFALIGGDGAGWHLFDRKEILLMSLRDAYRQKLAAQVEEQKARLGVLKAHAKRMAADSQIMGYEELEHAERSLGQLALKLRKVAGAGMEALGEVKQGMGRALDDITVSTKRAATRFSKTAQKPAAPKARRPATRRLAVSAPPKRQPAKRRVTTVRKARPATE